MKKPHPVLLGKGIFAAACSLLALASGSLAQTGSPVPVVTIRATTPLATAINRPGVFTVFRSGDTNAALNVVYQVAMNWFYADQSQEYGQATNGVDFAMVSGLVTIPAGAISNSILIQPFANPPINLVKTVTLELSEPTAAMGYSIAQPEHAVVFVTGRTNFPPTVFIYSPVENEAYTAPATIPIVANAYDWFDSVRTIEFFAGTNSLGVSTNAQIVWPKVPAGEYTLTAVATAYGGAATSAPVNIVVRASPPPTNQPPTASIVFPINGEVFLTNRDISIQASAFDFDGSVASVEILAGTNSLGFAKPIPISPIAAAGFPFPIWQGYVLTWSQPPPGNYALTAVATDDGGATTTSTPVNITVLAGPTMSNLPPAVEIASPGNGEMFVTPTNIYLSAFADDSDGQVTNVEFFAGTNDLGAALLLGILPGMQGPIPRTLDWTNPTPGEYVLTAVATDNGGASATSAPVNITVEAGPPPLVPVVTIQATDPIAAIYSPPTNPVPFTPLAKLGVFTVFRQGSTNLALNVYYQIGGTASNGVDYIQISNWVVIPAGATSNTITIGPKFNALASNVTKTVVLQLAPPPTLNPVNFEIGVPSNAVVYIERTNPPPFTPVAISSPQDGAVFYTPTNISITAWVIPLASNVEFYAGTNDLGQGFPGPQAGLFGGWYFLTWTNPPPGVFTLTAVASIYDGTSATSAPVNITVLPGPPPNQPPTVRIFSPPNGALFHTPANVQILARAADADGSVTNVEFFAGTNDLGQGLSLVLDPPGVNGVTGLVYFFNWQNVPTNDYSLTAVATDNGGLSTTSAPVNITVRSAPTNLPPVVRIISPPNGAVFFAPVNIPLFAYAFAFDWINNVSFDEVTNLEFYADGVELGPGQHVIFGPAPTPGGVMPMWVALLPHRFSLVWSNAPTGPHRLTAVAKDYFGNAATSAPVNLTVLASPPPPTNRPAVVNIVATDPVAIEGTNCWVWPAETNSPPTWNDWPPRPIFWSTNCGPKTATFAVRRYGDISNDLTVAYAIGGTASNGVDYVTLPRTVTIPAGERRADITIVPLDDGSPDITSTVVLRLVPDANSTNYLLGYPRAAAVVILDSQSPRAVTGIVPGPAFSLAAAGPDGAWFHVEASTDLIHWTPICTNQVVNGSINFVDPDAATNPAGYYRVVPDVGPPQ